MAWWHRVGQKITVRREYASPEAWLPGDQLPFGEVFVVQEVIVDENWHVGFAVVGCRPKNALYGWSAEFFTPVKGTSIESLRALLTEPPDLALMLEEEHAKLREENFLLRRWNDRQRAGTLPRHLHAEPDLLRIQRTGRWSVGISALRSDPDLLRRLREAARRS